MSGHGFHVHGPHDHEVEHVAQHGGDSFTSRLAVVTAVLSTVGAIFGYMGGHSQNAALLYKNEAAIQKTSASNQWNYYQAKSSKGHLMSVAADMVPPDRKEFYKKQIEKYEQEKKEIKATAEALEEESRLANEHSEHLMHPHHRLAQAMTLIQIAISLASITVLTRKRWLFAGAGIAATGGAVLWALSWLA